MSRQGSARAARLSRHLEGDLVEDDAPTLTREMSDGLEALRGYCVAAITQRWGPDLGGKLFAVFTANSAVQLTCSRSGAAFCDAFNTLASEVGSQVRMTSERAN